jgi:hypothetical protein
VSINIPKRGLALVNRAIRLRAHALNQLRSQFLEAFSFADFAAMYMHFKLESQGIHLLNLQMPTAAPLFTRSGVVIVMDLHISRCSSQESIHTHRLI